MNKRKESVIPISQAKKTKQDNGEIPDPPLRDPNIDKITFQLIGIDHYIGKVCPGMPGPEKSVVPIMRLFGVTEDQFSVCCHIHGYMPYFYVPWPDNVGQDDLASFKGKLNEAILAENKNQKKEPTPEAVLMIEIVSAQSIKEYAGQASSRKFAKISVTLPRFVQAAKKLLQSGKVRPPPCGYFISVSNQPSDDIELLFLNDQNLRGCAWIEIPAGKWKKRVPGKPKAPFGLTTRCALEVDVSVADLAPAPANDENVAPFKILSFDIECAGRKDIFPDAQFDPVIQIANVVQLHGQTEPTVRNVFTLKSCAPIDNADVHSFDTEEDMLNAWADFVRECDPDVLTGFYINRFDIPYLLNRAKTLNLKQFPYLGRVTATKSELKGRGRFKVANFEGRVIYDMWVIMKRDFKFPKYTLNHVSNEILGESKEDVHHSIITELQNGNDETRRRLAVYCIKDAELPMRLINKVGSFAKDVAASKRVGLTLTDLLLNALDK